MLNLETVTKSKFLIAAALAGLMMASCSQKPDSANEVATQQLVEATQKAEEAAVRAETAQKALQTAQAEQAAAAAKASADSEQAAAAAKLKAAEDRAATAERESAAAKKRAAAAERQVASSKPARSYTEARPATAAVCQDCGTVSDVTAIKVKGNGTGMGAVAGAIAGIAAGNQVGKGQGTDVAKVVGAIGGAYAGNQAEKYIRSETVFDVTVRMDNGTSRTVRVADASAISTGSRVRVDGSNLQKM